VDLKADCVHLNLLIIKPNESVPEKKEMGNIIAVGQAYTEETMMY